MGMEGSRILQLMPKATHLKAPGTARVSIASGAMGKMTVATGREPTQGK